VRLASRIEVDWLEEDFPDDVRGEQTVEFDSERQRAVGVTSLWYRDLRLREDRNAKVDPSQASEALAASLRDRAEAFVKEDDAASAWLARLEFVRRVLPEREWPVFDNEAFVEVVEQACLGRRTLEEARRASLAPLLRSRLTHADARDLDELAPESLRVPSGNRVRLVYETDRPPVLAVRLQELFGWLDTPRVAGGRVAVVLHLLGPNFRPVQVTSDLRSFWANAYFQVRKDLRARYPKHAWPEDPLTARPEAKGKRRS
jgi:ATP-dependent helicase HrpB